MSTNRRVKILLLFVLCCAILNVIPMRVPAARAQADYLPRGWYPVQMPLGAGAVDVYVTPDTLVTVDYDHLEVRYTYSHYVFARLWSWDGRYIVYLYLPARATRRW